MKQVGVKQGSKAQNTSALHSMRQWVHSVELFVPDKRVYHGWSDELRWMQRGTVPLRHHMQWLVKHIIGIVMLSNITCTGIHAFRVCVCCSM